jgi:pimeloyl-ACP methyl ester carboxylesterase
VTILTGESSELFYAPFADALAARIPGARRVGLGGLRHTGPVTDPAVVAAAVREALALAGVVTPAPEAIA